MTSFEHLADCFNDYENVVFQNVTREFENGVAVEPYVARAGFEAIAPSCYDLNPTNNSRPIRDGEWIKKRGKI
jgi:hypothetical protein